MKNQNPSPSGHRRLRLILLILSLWGGISYLLLPWLWKEYFRHDSKFLGADVDEERERIAGELNRCGRVQELRYVNGFQQAEGRNGGGYLWRTDGRLAILVLKSNPNAQASK